MSDLAGAIAIAQSDQRWAKNYSYAVGALIALLCIRNCLLLLSRFLSRRQKPEVASSEKGSLGRGARLYGQKHFIQRALDRVEGPLLKPVGWWGLPVEYTYLRVLLNVVIFVVNVVFCFVDGPMTLQKKYGFSTAAAFSLRTGMMATANYPILFLLAGRSNIVAFFTGISYIELRYYHIVVGVYAFWLSLVHTVCYVAHYYIHSTGATALAQACSQLYFKLGIIALVFMGTNWLLGLKWVRRRGYEIFLISHIVGAMLVLAGSYYHRPSMIPYTYAAAGIWVFERVCRWGLHIAYVAHARVGRWSAGQHYYVAFWGTNLLRRPHLYGQVHPFSTVNVSVDGVEEQELRFILRIHGGLTKELAEHIEKRCAANGGAETECLVTLEGPYGWAQDASEFDSVLLLAGGSGITHPLSTLHELTQQAAAEQANWVSETLAESLALAKQANLPVSVDLYITRPSSSSPSAPSLSAAPSLTNTPSTSSASTPSLDDEKEEDSFFSNDTVDFADATVNRFVGRPDVQGEVKRVVDAAGEEGRVLVVVCGPVKIADDVRLATRAFPRSRVVAEVATFEC
ncbi:hypothetical protein JCM6882_006311 [Rhodosporidiobolus microsporus]